MAFIIFFAWKKKLNIFLTIFIVVACSFVLNIYVSNNNVTYAYYLPFTRFWEISAGSLLAYFKLCTNTLLSKDSVSIFIKTSSTSLKINFLKYKNTLSLIGFILLITAFFLVNKEHLFPSWWALMPVFGTLFVISAGADSFLNRILLSNRIMIGIGLISYPLYLWHWPILSFLNIIENGSPTILIRVAALFISIVLAWLTYEFIEKPCRRVSNRKSTFILIVLMYFVSIIGVLIYFNNGIPSRLNKFTEINKQFIPADDHAKSLIELCKNDYPILASAGYCIKQKSGEPTILLLGDSHSGRMYHGLGELISNTQENLMVIAGGGCLPFINIRSNSDGNLNTCTKSMNDSISFALSSNTINTVVFIARGPLYLSGHGYGQGNDESGHHRELRIIDRSEISNPYHVYEFAMRNTLNKFYNKNIKIIFVLDVPELGFDPRTCANNRPLQITRNVRSPCAVSRFLFDERNKDYRNLVFKVLRDYPSVKVFDPSQSICDDKLCWAEKDGKFIYRDDDHLSIEGSKFLAHDLYKIIK